MSRFLFCSYQRVTRKQLVVTILTSVVLFNEWLTYAASSLSWPSLHTPSDEHVRVLFAADPQILSLLSDSEPIFPLSLITIWDADRFVSRGFQMALWKTKPDIVVFLGDLLNDGSIVNDNDFNATLGHFKNLLSVPNYVKHTIFLPGDNDIGGEGNDLVTPHKINRFYAFLNQSMTLQYKFIDFIQMRVMDDFTFPDNKLPPEEGRVRILLSHMPLLTRTRERVKQKIIKQQPSFIFSGHEHESFHFTGMKEEGHAQDFQVLKDNQRVWHFESAGTLLHEIVVPTCSYRMGQVDAGYGAAVIEKSGGITYTVLWLPSRFEQLWLYVGFLVLLIVIMILPETITSKMRWAHTEGSLSWKQ
ncbi:uncharacterized protein LOC127000863 isoform X4 [Eriocheir sinensis]|uniref:uncharacterized protein LOC127000863 isoform X4 n=1 Tax=Eriocheir sinensis TaxID=95602 RepID=UPI0021C5B5A5|nr:uncharacterized protein LOC127000863 isoform X4 [Eriocheir sinensis]